MSDIFCEFINASNLGYSDLLSGVTLVSNAVNETAVVRDIVVNNPLRRPLVISVGSNVVATVNESAKLSGAEILPPGTSMQLKLNSSAVFNELYQYGNSQSVLNKISFPTCFSGEVLPNGVGLHANNVLSQAFYGTPAFLTFDASGNFYYATTSGNMLYKRSGGVNGIQTAINFGNQAFCYDGNRFIYSFLDNNLYTYDTLNGAVSSKVITLSPNSSYSSASALEGKIYIRTHYSIGNSFIVDASSGVVNPAPGSPMGTASSFPVGIGKDLNGNYIIWQADFYNGQSCFYCWNIGKNINSPFVQQFQIIPFPFSRNFSSPNMAGFVRQNDNSSMFYYAGGSEIVQLDISNKSVSRCWNLPNAPLNGMALFIPPVNIAKANVDFGSVGVRVAGVKST